MLTDKQITTNLAIAAGETALDILGDDHSGKVLAPVTQAVYLVNEHGELFWLTTPGIPMHRRGIRVTGHLPRPAAGAAYQINQGILRIDPFACLDLRSCPVWKAPEAPGEQAIPLARLPGFVSDTYRNFLEWPKPAGMGTLIPAILQMALHTGQPTGSGLVTKSLHTLLLPVQGIVRACLGRDPGLLLQHAASLVGLGSGLTPSGDDFLGGVFFAFALLRQTYPEIRELQNWNYSNFLTENQSKTNLISFTLLKDHEAGHGMEPLHYFTNALLAGKPIDESLPYASELVAVGHSTGWDLLTGLLSGMTILFAQ